MSSKYSGLQTRIRNHSATAFYIPCANHSLNLVGNCAAESSTAAIIYFDFVQKLFTFFSASTKKWNMLSKLPLVLKRISDTRWSARADAVLALKSGYHKIKETLKNISTSPDEKLICRLEASKLANKFDDYETALLTTVWSKILSRLNATSESLQGPTINIYKGANLLKSLDSYILEIRSNFEVIKNETKLLTNETQFRYEQGRIKKRKVMFDEVRGNDAILLGQQSFIVNTLNVICDKLSADLNGRLQIYEENFNMFKIFFIESLPENELNSCIDRIIEIYKNDIDVETFRDELIQFLAYVNEENIISAADMYATVNDGFRSTFPNIETILKIFLIIPMTNTSGERFFSVLKRVKNYLIV